MTIRISSFAGETPRVIPRLLQTNFAQVAENTKLQDGALVPTRLPRPETVMAENARTIFRNLGHWFSWPGRVNVARAPVAENRIYVTGDGPGPTMLVGDDGVKYPLFFNRPTSAVFLVTIDGVYDQDIGKTILYVITYVTVFSEESEPSPVSAEFLVSANQTVHIQWDNTIFTLPSRIVKINLYRSETTAAGDTQFYLIAELGSTEYQFADNPASRPIQEALVSQSYNAPPDGLRGIIALPNGMMAAFVGKKLYFSEPYRPHAWPEKYILTVDYNIVGLGAYSSIVAVMTEGCPYICQGTAPENMSMERMDVDLPCLNPLGIVDMGYAIAYPSHDGLVTISSNGAVVATKTVFTTDQWLALRPDTFIAGRYAGRYMATFNRLNADGSAELSTVIIDLSGDQPFIMRSTDQPVAMYYEAGTGNLFMVQGDGVTVTQYDEVNQNYAVQTWRSKKFVLQADMNYGCIQIEGDPLGAGQSVKCRVYADGVLRNTITTVNKTERLSSGFLATVWEVEIESNSVITAISIAGSPSELATGE